MRGPKIVLAVVTLLVARCSKPANTIGDVPPPPDAGATASESTSTFAFDRVFVGEVDRSGSAPSADAWMLYGYDLDGKSTVATSVDVCSLASGAPPANQRDGVGGIDNAWGGSVLPLLQTGASLPQPSATFSSAIKAGHWTLQIQVTGLSADPHQNAVGLHARVFVSGELGAVPVFDTTTDWPVLPSSLADGSDIASGALVEFDDVYVTDGTVVAEHSTEPVTVPLAWEYDAVVPLVVPLPLRIHRATLTFEHADDATATQGTIAGVLDTRELVSALRLVADVITANTKYSTCGAAFEGIESMILQSQDILSDASNAAGFSCNAISIGIGFTAKRVANPTKLGVDPAPPADPCGIDAGATDATTE